MAALSLAPLLQNQAHTHTHTDAALGTHPLRNVHHTIANANCTHSQSVGSALSNLLDLGAHRPRAPSVPSPQRSDGATGGQLPPARVTTDGRQVKGAARLETRSQSMGPESKPQGTGAAGTGGGLPVFPPFTGGSPPTANTHTHTNTPTNQANAAGRKSITVAANPSTSRLGGGGGVGGASSTFGGGSEGDRAQPGQGGPVVTTPGSVVIHMPPAQAPPGVEDSSVARRAAATTMVVLSGALADASSRLQQQSSTVGDSPATQGSANSPGNGTLPAALQGPLQEGNKDAHTGPMRS